MKLLLIGGFLGSGKTTLLVEIARRMTESAHTIAIIENEIGEIGIDNQYLRQEGLEVQEVFGGCVCCTLQIDLIKTLKKVKQVIKPDWTLLEPTGLADPGDIVAAVHQFVPEVDDVRVLIVVDAVRYPMFAQMMTPMVAAQLQSADILAINKIDEVEAADLTLVAKSVREFHGQVKMIRIAAERGTNMDALLEELL